MVWLGAHAALGSQNKKPAEALDRFRKDRLAQRC
jgi:hypothetical protein